MKNMTFDERIEMYIRERVAIEPGSQKDMELRNGLSKLRNIEDQGLSVLPEFKRRLHDMLHLLIKAICEEVKNYPDWLDRLQWQEEHIKFMDSTNDVRRIYLSFVQVHEVVNHS